MIGDHEVAVAMIGALGAAVVAAISVFGIWLQARKTRRLNSEEHAAGTREREAAHQAIMVALTNMNTTVQHGTDLLVNHIQDPNAHGRSTSAS